MAVPQEFHHIREKFKSEVHQHLDDAAAAIRSLDPGNKVILDRIARHLHAIKGSAPIVGAKPVSEVARAAEESIHLINESPGLWNSERASALLDSFEFIRHQVREYVEGKAIDDPGNVIGRLRTEFPGAEEAARKAKAVSPKSVMQQVTSQPPAGGEKFKILFVDDSQIARELYKVFLVNRGYAVETAADGAAALSYLRSTPVDLVITDDQMPEMDGTELLRICKSEKALKETPFIVISGKANEEARIKALTWGAAAYLIKGDFEKEHLLEVLTQVLNK